MLADYHIHVVAHGEYEYNYDWLCRFLENAQAKKLNEIGFSEHDEYISLINTEVISKVQDEFPDIKIKLGLEVDYIPGRENKIKEIIASKSFDYIIGSVHFIGDWGFDHPDYKQRFEEQDIDEIYENYFDLVGKAVKSGLFDIVGHIDLIKKWGHRPKKQNISYYIEPLLNNIKASGMAIEINSSGLRKPVKELYPEFSILEMIRKLDIPVTFASDAHHPDEIGENLEQAFILAQKIGIKQQATFDKRKKILVPLMEG